MYLDSENRHTTLTPQLAWRVAIVGGVALVAFAVIFFRLWYLQVLSGNKYVAEARNNQIREIKVRAPRGEIVDRDGRPLVDNRTGLAVKLSPDKLPAGQEARRELYGRLAKVLRMKPGEVEKDVSRQLKALPFSKATVKPDVPLPLVQYLLENPADFPASFREAVTACRPKLRPAG